MDLFKIPSEIISIIVSGIVELIKGKHAEKISKTDSVDERSSVEDINKVLEMFSDYKNQIGEKTSKVEEILTEEVEAYIKELQTILDRKQDVIKKYGLRPERLERRFSKLTKSIQGSISREVSKKVSLDNYECSQIIRMIPGAKKEKALTSFFNDTVKSALNKCCDDLQLMLEEFYEETEEELIEVINIAQKNNEQNVIDLAAVDKDNYAEKTLGIQEKAYRIIAVCDVLDSIVKED